MARVVLTGATGTIGGAVCRALLARGDRPVALSRDADRAASALAEGVEVHSWAQPTREPPPAEVLSGSDAVIHLAGEPVAQRWSTDAKRRIRESRQLTTELLVGGLRELSEQERPRVLISQSATGYYGSRTDTALDEQGSPGDDFLASVVKNWEEASRAADPLLRVVNTRTGVVLAPGGGALAKMLPFFRAGIGGPIAGGRQYVPWIHIDDVVDAMLFCRDNADAEGPVNLVAPNPVTNAEFSHALGTALHRPAVLPVPGLALRLLYGEMAQMIITGQRAVPVKLQEAGFQFRHPLVAPALADVLGSG